MRICLAKVEQKYTAQEEQELMMALWSPEIADDPYMFVKFCYPWGKENTPLSLHKEPRKWQIEELLRIKEHIKMNKDRMKQGENPIVYKSSTASGRGVGKSALTAWLNHWAMSCHIGGTCITTANTESQLKSRTWAELGKWHTLSINSHWFERMALSLRPAEWFKSACESDGFPTGYYYAEAQTWSEENSDAFAGAHNPQGMMVIFDEACHDDRTEVLTDRGWVFWKDVNSFHKLMTMDPKTHKAEYLKPEKLQKFKKNGVMCLYKAKGANFCVTPNHDLFYTTQKLRPKNLWKKKPIGLVSNNSDLYLKRTMVWEGREDSFHQILELKTQRKTHSLKQIPMDEWLWFLGWFISEGHIEKDKEIPSGLGISQKDKSVLLDLQLDLKRWGFKSSIHKTNRCYQLKVGNAQLARHLEDLGVGSKNIRMPRYVLDLSSRQIRIFLNAFMLGDGYKRSCGAEVCYTSSKNLADDLQEAYLKTGKKTSLVKRKIKGLRKWIIDHWATSCSDGYVVRASNENDHIKFNKSKMQIINYNGWVYCASVPPNHLLLTRREGCVFWSGNSGIPKPIWTVTEGFFTEPALHRYWFAFSNPRRNTGEFYETFHESKKYWYNRNLDSRTVAGTDHRVLQEIVDKNGEDSDEARIEVKGLFPSQGDAQFISRDIVDGALYREVEFDHQAPLIFGVDVARFGDDTTVIAFRRGRDATQTDWVKLKSKDNMEVANEIAFWINELDPDAVNIDAGNGTGVIDRLREMGYKVNEVWFGSKPTEPEYADLRTEMWGKMRDWLRGAVIPADKDLVADLVGPEYEFDKQDRIKLESKEKMKKRGIQSPDAGDALACTFAVHVARKDKKTYRRKKSGRVVKGTDYAIFG